jgi:nucleoid-associated protein YgaU
MHVMSCQVQEFEKSQVVREQQRMMEQAEAAAKLRLAGNAGLRLSPAAMEARETALREMMALETRAMELEAIEKMQRSELLDAQSELERTMSAAESAREAMQAAAAARHRQQKEAHRVKNVTIAAVAKANAEQEITQRALEK